MAHADHEITHLIAVDPTKAKAKILQALKAARMHKAVATKEIGCSHGTFLRWIVRLGMQQEIEEMAAKAVKEGWHHEERGGRPQGSTVANGAAPRNSRTKVEKKVPVKVKRRVVKST